MLHEVKRLRQSQRSHVKRWFTSRDMDLFIWFANNEPVRFQLSYDKCDIEKAISWNFHLGFSHYLVDTGETELHHYKQTPILIHLYNQGNLKTIARDFLAASENIGIDVSDFIFSRLMALPATTTNRSARHVNLFRK